MQAAPVPLTYTKENGVWIVIARSRAPFPLAPRFVSWGDYQARRAEVPMIFGKPRRVSAVLFGPSKEQRWAILETGNPPQMKIALVTVGQAMVGEVQHNGVVLQEKGKRFLVPLTSLAPMQSCQHCVTGHLSHLAKPRLQRQRPFEL